VLDVSVELVAVVVALVHVIGNAAARVAAENALRKAASLAQDAINRRKAHAQQVGDPLRATIEANRLDETSSTLASDVETMVAEPVDWAAVDAEVSEPAFERFVNDALAQSAETAITSKRLLLGKMIAARLQVKTDSPQERSLRRALAILPDLTEEQLKLLAAIALVTNLPIDDIHATTPFGSRDEAEQWLRESVYSVAQRLKNTSYWTREDFESLASIGCIRIPESPSSPEFMAGGRTTSVDHWLSLHGVSPYDGLEGEWGSKESHEKYRSRFPTITLLNALVAGGKLNKEKRQMQWAWPLDTVILTPIGESIALSVLGQMTGQQFEKRLFWIRYPKSSAGAAIEDYTERDANDNTIPAASE